MDCADEQSGDTAESHIRAHANAYAAKGLCVPGTPPVVVIGDTMLWMTTAFAQTDTDPCFRSIRSKYLGDLPLFEIAAYMLFRIDLWLFTKYPAHRRYLVNSFFNHIGSAFERALGVDVSLTLKSRIEAYSTMVRRGTDTGEFLHNLGQILLMSREARTPVEYSFGGPIMLSGADEDFWIRSNLAAFEGAIVPTFLNSLEKFIETVLPRTTGTEMQ
ncbi:MAG: hypothetical protein GXY38_07370 [Planctomycetes bacterium]|nr:hypothetical protein [Planctomycetota bacterium]